MIKIEKKFWNKLKSNLMLNFLKRLENEVETGWPDVFYLHEGYEGFIELKAEMKFPNRIDFQPAQPNWLVEYSANGGNCWVMLHVVGERNIYLWYGSSARQLNESGGTSSVRPAIVVKCDQIGYEKLKKFILENSRKL